MKHVNSILVCVHPNNPDPDLIERAADLAKKNEAAVKVFHVVSEYPEDMSEWWNVRNPQKLHDKIVKEREGYLIGVVQKIKDNGVANVTHELRWGKTFLEITKEVIDNKHDLAMITSRNIRKLRRMVAECPSVDLLRYCPCTLWISKGRALPRARRLVAALWGKGGHVKCGSLNAKILRAAAAVAESSDSELNVVHALPVYGGKGVKGDKLRSDLVEFMDKLRVQITEQCAGVLSDFELSLDKKHVHLLTGTPAVAIPDFVSREGMDLIVMGSIAKTTIPGLLIGSTAERVYDSVSCSVLAVKPDDFVSLVEREEEKTPEKQAKGEASEPPPPTTGDTAKAESAEGKEETVT